MPRDGKYPCFAGHFTEGGDFYLSKSGFFLDWNGVETQLLMAHPEL